MDVKTYLQEIHLCRGYLQMLVLKLCSSSSFPFLSRVKLLVPMETCLDRWKHVCVTTLNVKVCK